MLSRLVSICRPSLSLSRHHLSLPHFPSPSPSLPPSLPPLFTLRLFGTTTNGDGGNNNNDDTPSDSTLDAWKLSTENDDLGVFGTQEEEQGGSAAAADEGWEFNKPWSVGADNKEDVFGSLGESGGSVSAESLRGEETQKKEAADQVALLNEEERLTAILKGPNRAFGDLVAASGISDAMLDSLMALKNFDGITGLPPLTEIEDMRYQKSLKDLSKAEMERLKQEEIAKSRVRTVDEIGRAYGTGKRKCSIARVWLQPGAGKFVVNDKEFDVYFPMLDHRAALLRPFSETKTLGLWDVKCTVKGGGVSGQVGAVRLGVSKALQNWEPGLRPPLREAGFLTRDSRVVERKKPGKAKARKSFQWVKR